MRGIGSSPSVTDFRTMFQSPNTSNPTPSLHLRSSSTATSIHNAQAIDEFVQISSQFDLMIKRAHEIDDADLYALFDMALDCGYAGTNDSKRESMRRLPKDQKLQLVKQVYVQCTSSNNNALESEKSPSFYIESLRHAHTHLTNSLGKSMTNSIVNFVTRSTTVGISGSQPSIGGRHGVPIKDSLAQLRIQCTSSGDVWLRQFLDLGGLEALFTLLHSIHAKKEKKQKYVEAELEILKILKMSVNHEKEINDLLAKSEWINVLTFSLDSPILSSRISATDFLLALVALNYPKGHNLVIRAFETHRNEHRGLRLFERFMGTISEIVESRGTFGSVVGSKRDSVTGSVAGIVSMNREKSHREMKDYLISALALIRYIVQVPSQLEYRIHLRNELMACGLFKVFKTLKTWAPAENAGIMVHVLEFENRAQQDHDEFVEGMDAGICDEVFDMEDEHKVLNVLMESYKTDEVGKEYVRSILKHLLIPTRMIDEVSRTKFLQLVDTLLSQMVLDGKGLQCDFFDTYKVPVNELIQGFIEQDEVADMKADMVKTKLKLSEITAEKRKLERDLDSPRSELQPNTKEAMKFSTMQDILRQKDMELEEQTQRLIRLKVKQEAFLHNLKHDLTQFKPSMEVRRLQWDRLPDMVAKDSVWLKKITSVTTDAVSSKSAKKGVVEDVESKLDAEGVFKDIQSRFGVKPRVVKCLSTDEVSIGKLSDGKDDGVVGKAVEVTLIDGKKVIMLGRLKQYTTSELVKYVMTINETIMSESIIKQLVTFLPSKDEEEALNAFKGDFSTLRKSDQFLIDLLRIPYRGRILDSILFKLSFSERFKALDDDLSCGLSAVSCLDKSDKFLRVLEIVLSLGNFMNSGTFIGSVYGFRINSINKLADVRSTEGKGSLLHFLADVVDSKFPELSGFMRELQECIPAARLSLEALKSDLKILQKELKDMLNLVAILAGAENNSNDVRSYLEIITPFSKTANETVSELKGRTAKLETTFSKLVAYFGEDPEKTPFDEFFGMFKLFLQSYEKASSENAAERDRQAKLEKRKRLQEERESQRAASSSKLLPTLKPDAANSKAGNMMDDILASLKGGSILLDAPLSQNEEPRVHGAPRRPIGALHSSNHRKVSTSAVGNQALAMLEQLQF
ncbi:hypothetical protein HDU98_006303 [Podochytrium sp. JEL0797]|nr:hypothetical protein HDU98_006303 [Podochytrium sp. JEL0797]